MDFHGLRESIPNSIAQLSSNIDPCNYDLWDMGPGEDIVGEVHHGDRKEEDDMELDQQTPVNSMSLAFFRRQLVVHFSIMFTWNLIKWPKNRKGSGIGKDRLFN